MAGAPGPHAPEQAGESQPLRIVFMGSGAFAIPSFEALLAAGHELSALVTQPDRARGRGRALAPPPLKPVAERHGVPVLQPNRIREPEALAALRSLAPELIVVVAFGQILPRAILELPPRGTLNVHASLLPRYRGAAPIQWAIARGEQATGVTTMLLDEGMDTGPTLLAVSIPIGPDDTAVTLEPRLATLGAETLLATIRGLGLLTPKPQDHARASLAPILRKEDGRLDWAMPAGELALRVRGFQPWPGTYTSVGGCRLKVLRARAEGRSEGSPGTVLAADASGVLLACGGGTCLRLLEVQPESRKAMSAAAFVAGARLERGARLD